VLRFIPFFIIAAILLIAIGAAMLFKHQAARQRLALAFNQNLKKFPGQRDLERLDELNEDIMIQSVSLLALPLAIYAGIISILYFGDREINRSEAFAAAGIALLFLGYSLFKLQKLLQERRMVRLGHAGEMIVGQALNRLLMDGYRVFHDFTAEKVNINHIVVGAKGVFTVETQTQVNRAAHDRQQDATVEYDGRALHFPNGTNIDMIEKAERQAEWLSGWLRQSVGADIAVRAIIALPGWLVKRTASIGIPIVNPQQFDSLFQHIQPRPLSGEMITKIACQLDQKCQDIASS
jgi:hypothetical protein